MSKTVTIYGVYDSSFGNPELQSCEAQERAGTYRASVALGAFGYGIVIPKSMAHPTAESAISAWKLATLKRASQLREEAQELEFRVRQSVKR